MNWELLGHDWAVGMLKENVKKQRVRHAYLITGPEGVGRRTLSIRLAQALNCENSEDPGEPCFTCRNCEWIEKMKHPDLAVVQSEGRQKALSVEKIRELSRYLSFTPYEARYKIAILLRFEEASASASNALLKTLEEPASKVVIILNAVNTDVLLPTIVSRCEVIRLQPLPIDRLSHDLSNEWEIPQEEAEILAHVFGGRPGLARRFIESGELMAERNQWLDEHIQLLASDRVERFVYAWSLSNKRDVVNQVLACWLSFWRDIFLCAARSSTPLSNIDRKEEISVLSEEFGPDLAADKTRQG